jgi:hypothetical protein
MCCVFEYIKWNLFRQHKFPLGKTQFLSLQEIFWEFTPVAIQSAIPKIFRISCKKPLPPCHQSRRFIFKQEAVCQGDLRGGLTTRNPIPNPFLLENRPWDAGFGEDQRAAKIINEAIKNQLQVSLVVNNRVGGNTP